MTDEQAGTPAPTQEGGTATAAGTPAAVTDGGTSAGLSDAEKQELEHLRAFREQALGEKGALSEARERIRELESQQRGSHPPPTGYDPAAVEAAEALRNLQERDPDAARAILALGALTQGELQKRDAEFQRREAQARFARELNAVPAEHRAEAERIARAENIWPSLAFDRIGRMQWEKERQTLAEQSRKLQEERDRLARGVVSTTASPAPHSPTSNEITPDEYRQICRDAANGNQEARVRLRDYDAGRLKIKGG